MSKSFSAPAAAAWRISVRSTMASIGLALLLAACVSAPPPPPPPHVATPPAWSEVGLASWYGPGFQSGQTSTGERFDMNALTAAHRSLPINARVRVTNLENGRSVVVRINDRGPVASGRIIDVSMGAARALGMTKDGVAHVRLELVGDRDTPL